MKVFAKEFTFDRRQFLAASGGLLAAGVPGSSLVAQAAESLSSSAAPLTPRPAGNLRNIPIGVFDPVYKELSLDAMLDKVSALGLEVMEIGTGGYPENHHCPLDDLVADRAKAKAWRKKFEDRGIRVATLSCHGNPLHPDAKHAQRDIDTFRKTVLLAEMLDVKVAAPPWLPIPTRIPRSPSWRFPGALPNFSSTKPERATSNA